ncbi:MAG: hypothetical protein QG671_4489 [Actinomycetota bacterium]|jgi:multidrug efflux pump subunit AcrA (membrane-fusion protein)|nr:hypothetical protein [Actinomycetota bacterium]HQZ86505.1 hypothetical protein [Actinomycetota bacterium]
MSRSPVTVETPEYEDGEEPVVAHALVVTPRRVWVAVVSIVACALAVGVWLAAAQSPTVVRGSGLLLPPYGVVTVVAPAAGTVVTYRADVGDRVSVGQEIAVIRPSSGPDVPVVSNFAGELINGGRLYGDPVEVGDILAEIVPAQGTGKVGTSGAPTLTTTSVFVPIGQVSSLNVGMPAAISVQQFPESQYGAIRATVSFVTPAPASSKGLLAYAGGNDSLLKSLDIDQPVVQVYVDLQSDPSTPSGYAWTLGSGPPSPVLLVSSISMRAVASRQALVPLFGVGTVSWR